jgi:hypothetical protein
MVSYVQIVQRLPQEWQMTMVGTSGGRGATVAGNNWPSGGRI